ncbi:hypothetical protein ABPG77_007326 [Micractinium sp. CCAP 211/92]
MGATCSKAPALLDCKVLDTPDELRFDAITRLLASLFTARPASLPCLQVPISVVGLIDQDRLWLKSIVGVETREGQRLHSFCDASLCLPCPTMMVVPDTLADVRFQRNQFVVNPPYVRFYAGAPLVSSEGCVLGSLAVMDIKPRTIPAEVANLMTNFAELVVRELEKDKARALRQAQLHRDTLHTSPEPPAVRKLAAFDEAVLLCDVSAKGWPILFVNSQWCKATGASEAASLHTGFWSLFHFASQGDTAQLLYAYAAIEERKPFALTLAPGPAQPAVPGGAVTDAEASGGPSAVVLEFRPATADHVSQDCPRIGIPSLVRLGTKELAPGEESVELPEGLYFAVMKERLPGPLLPALAEPAAQLAQPQPPSAATEQAAEQASGLALPRASPPPVPHLRLSVQNTLPPPRIPEPPTPLADHEDLAPPRVSGVSQPSAGAQLSCDAPSPCSPGRQMQRSVSTPWTPCPFGQEVPEALSGLVVGPLLGRGANGSVYRGRMGEDIVAVKIIDCFVEADPLTMQPRQDPQPVLEAMLSQNLGRHSNIVQTLKFSVKCIESEELAPGDKLHESVWIIQELCDRGTLYDALDRGWLRASPAADAPPNMRGILQTAQDIAAALAFLHSHNILHGDLAGSNVLLADAPADPRGFRAKVSDFGVSRILQSIQCETTTLGTISHMPPEMLSLGLLSKATDVYSFGCLCWELYTGRHAWGGRRMAQIVHAKTVLHQCLELPPHCPSGFKALVESCLDSDHTKRPRFDDILAALQALIREVTPGLPA